MVLELFPVVEVTVPTSGAVAMVATSSSVISVKLAESLTVTE